MEREQQVRQQRMIQLNARTRHPRWGGTYSVKNVITGDHKISSQQLSHLNPRSDDIGVELFRASPKKSRAATRHHAGVSSSSLGANLGCVNSRPAAHLLQVAPIPQISLKTLLRFARDFATMNFERMIINHQPSIINHQSSIINHQSSIINHQSSIINHDRFFLRLGSSCI